MNDLVATTATEFRKNPPGGFASSDTSPLIHPVHGAVVISGGAVITSKLSQVIYGNIYLDPLLDTLWKRYKWDDSIYMEDIDWKAHGGTFTSYSRFQQIGLSKMVHSLWHTGAEKPRRPVSMLFLSAGFFQQCLPMPGSCSNREAAEGAGQTRLILSEISFPKQIGRG